MFTRHKHENVTTHPSHAGWPIPTYEYIILLLTLYEPILFAEVIWLAITTSASSFFLQTRLDLQ